MNPYSLVIWVFLLVIVIPLVIIKAVLSLVSSSKNSESVSKRLFQWIIVTIFSFIEIFIVGLVVVGWR